MDWVPCPSGTGCVPAEWICDGDRDCRDGSDENDELCNSKCFKCIFGILGTMRIILESEGQ